jgi:hypothetical protein
MTTDGQMRDIPVLNVRRDGPVGHARLRRTAMLEAA